MINCVIILAATPVMHFESLDQGFILALLLLSSPFFELLRIRQSWEREEGGSALFSSLTLSVGGPQLLSLCVKAKTLVWKSK